MYQIYFDELKILARTFGNLASSKGFFMKYASNILNRRQSFFCKVFVISEEGIKLSANFYKSCSEKYSGIF